MNYEGDPQPSLRIVTVFAANGEQSLIVPRGWADGYQCFSAKLSNATLTCVAAIWAAIPALGPADIQEGTA